MGTIGQRHFLKWLLVILVITSFITAEAQLSVRDIKRNNYRMYTYRGKRKVKFGLGKQYTSIDVTFNTLHYFGDLSPSKKRVSTDLSLTKPGIGIAYSRRIGSRFSLQSNFLYGTISGSDHKSADKRDFNNAIFRYNRNLSFRNRIKELSFVLVCDYFANSESHLERVIWTPYVSVGFSFFHHNPQAQIPANDLHGKSFVNAGQWVNLQPLGTEGQYAKLNPSAANYGIKPYKLVQPSLIVCPGVRVRLSDNIDISMEMSFRYLFTDYIDDVSRNYIDPGMFGSNELAKAMAYRSNEIASPTYTFTSDYDGMTYSVLPGYGYEHPGNMRGQKKDRDIFTVTTIRVGYIFEKYRMHKAKTR